MKKSTLALLAAGSAAFYYWKKSQEKIAWKSFTNRVALVMGGSRGLGLELARELLGEGTFVSICARDAEELVYARESLSEISGNITTFQCDVTSPEDIRRVVEAVIEQFGRLDLLINNVGVIRVGAVELMDIEDFRRAMDINYWGAVHATLAALPIMKRQHGGRVVNVASISEIVPSPHLVPYDASKAALIAFSEGLSAEMGDGIRIMTVCPGLSISAKSASKKILAACLRGGRELLSTLPARIMRKFVPELVSMIA